jgi:hypothetical protein
MFEPWPKLCIFGSSIFGIISLCQVGVLLTSRRRVRSFFVIYVWVVTPVASLEVDFWDVGVGVDAQSVFLSRF